MSKSRLPDPKIGDRFGKLVILRLHKDHTATVRRVWLMQCDCGKQKPYTYADVRHGRIVSCGCLRGPAALGGRKQYERGIGTHSPKTLYSVFCREARKRNLVNELSFEQWQNLRWMPCGYCGGETTGIDRIDSSIGYVSSNVTAACERCNKMKGSQSAWDWYAQIERVLQHTGKREPKRYLEEMKP